MPSVELPSGRRLGEDVTSLDKAEGDRGTHRIDWPQFRIQFPFVLGLIDLIQAADQLLVLYLIGDSFHDHRFFSLLGTDNAVRVGREVSRLSRISTGAEIEDVLDPDTPDHHRVRSAVRSSGAQEVISRSLQAFDRPRPWQQSLAGVALGNSIAGRMWSRSARLVGALSLFIFHRGSLRHQGLYYSLSLERERW